MVAGDEIEKSSIDDLNDVLLKDLADKQILVYDALSSTWVNKNASDALDAFVGATAQTAGVPGLVPGAALGQTNLFLRSDGTWAAAEGGGSGADNHIINIENNSNKTHAEVIEEAIADLTIIKGDMIIITDIIIGDNIQQSAYCYDGDTWISLNSNIVSEKQVIFVDDLTGIEASGKNLNEVLETILAKPSVSADNVSISIDNNIISLKNYGVQYYRFIEATETEEAHYELQVVNEDYPWKAGLESRTVEEDGQLVIGWYEPNTQTLDGVSAAVATLQEQVVQLESEKADADSVYTKEETNAQIAAAAHLKRKEVESTDDIDVTADDATQYIYMVPSGLSEDDNKYYEYIVVEVDVIDEETGEITKARKIEKVGSWEVNLADYAKTADVNTALQGKVDKVDGYRLISEEEATKLSGVEAGAQVNKIEAVDGSFSIGENKTLHLNDIAISKVSGLLDALDNKVDKDENARLITNDEANKLNSLLGITAVSTDFQIVDGTLSFNLESLNLATKAELEDLTDRVDALEGAATWGDIV